VAVGTSYGSVANYLNRAEKAGISWPLSDSLSEQYPSAHGLAGYRWQNTGLCSRLKSFYCL